MIRSSLLLPDGSLIQEEHSLESLWRERPGSRLWIDLADEDPASEEALLRRLGCHPLAIQDAQRLRHPPKFEVFDERVFVLYRGLAEVDSGLVLEQLPIALFVSRDLLVSRHPGKSVSIDRWWQGSDLGRYLRQPFLLALRIVHGSFDLYLQAVLDFEHQLADKEEAMQGQASDEDLRELTAYKAKLRKLRRIFNYHERMASGLRQLTRGDKDYESFFHEAQDLHERADRIASLLTMYYEICGDLIEGYLSITSHQLNRTMQVLTVITSIFVPLGFLAGVYGMNFQNMPELENEYGYFVLLAAMGIIAAGALTLFKLKRWL